MRCRISICSNSQGASGTPNQLKAEPSGSSIVTTGGTLEERIENALKAQKEEPQIGRAHV